jgi:hypothetical protein
MRINVKGGTARGDEDLCATCRYSLIRVGSNGAKTVKCDFFGRVWYEPTVECSNYSDRRVPYLGEMKEIAWTVTPNPKGKVGFEAPKAPEKSSPFRAEDWE